MPTPSDALHDPFWMPAGEGSDYLDQKGLSGGYDGGGSSGGGSGPNDPLFGILSAGADDSASLADVFLPRRRLERGAQIRAQRMRPIPQQSPYQATRMPAYRHGCGHHPGGWAMVGEDGPEMVELPEGASVYPNPRTVPHYAYGTPNTYGSMNYSGLNRQPTMQGYGMRQPGSGGGGGWGGRMGGFRPPAPRPQPGHAPGAPPSPYGDRGEYGLPNDSYIGPDGQFSGPQFLQGIVGLGTRAGLYDPFGSAVGARQIYDEIQGRAGDRGNAAMTAADLWAGGDPSLRAVGRQQAQLDTQRDAARAYGSARSQQMSDAADFYRSILMGPIAGAWTRRDPKPGEVLAQTGGQMIGDIGSSWLSRPY